MCVCVCVCVCARVCVSVCVLDLVINNFPFLKASFNKAIQTFNALNATRIYQRIRYTDRLIDRSEKI